MFILAALLSACSIQRINCGYVIQQVDECGLEEIVWERSASMCGSNTDVYHCILINNTMVKFAEICMAKKMISASAGCPWIDVTRDPHIVGEPEYFSCPMHVRGCPQGTYFFSNELYKYPKCLMRTLTENDKRLKSTNQQEANKGRSTIVSFNIGAVFHSTEIQRENQNSMDTGDSSTMPVSDPPTTRKEKGHIAPKERNVGDSGLVYLSLGGAFGLTMLLNLCIFGYRHAKKHVKQKKPAEEEGSQENDMTVNANQHEYEEIEDNLDVEKRLSASSYLEPVSVCPDKIST